MKVNGEKVTKREESEVAVTTKTKEEKRGELETSKLSTGSKERSGKLAVVKETKDTRMVQEVVRLEEREVKMPGDDVGKVVIGL